MEPDRIRQRFSFCKLMTDVRASEINEEMKMAAALAIAETLPDAELSAEKIVPDALDPYIFHNVSEAVRKAAIETGVARI